MNKERLLAMKIIRKIEVNNQNVLVIAKEKNTFYKWLEDKSGNRDLDPFWNSVITESVYNQVLEDYNSGLIKTVHRDFQTVESLFVNFSDSEVLNITNWIAHAYMSWNKDINGWSYGRNRNYIEELKK